MSEMTHEESVQRHPAMRRTEKDNALVRFVASQAGWWDADWSIDDLYDRVEEES